MLILDAVVALAAIGCATWVATLFIARTADRRHAPLREQLRAAHDRILLLEQQKDHLEQQLAWHIRLLSTLENQHRVPEAEEAVPLADGALVRPPDQLAAGEGAHQHQQGRTRQVEVGDQRIHGLEPVARVDE